MIKYTFYPTLLFAFVFFSGAFAQINYQLYQNFPKGPVGGGPAYENRVVDDATFTKVNNVAELRNALTNPSIKKVFIPGQLSFEINQPLVITTNGLVLASDRGRLRADGKVAPGAQLKLLNTSVADNKLLIGVNADEVRISGLRITAENVEPASVGIQITPQPNRNKIRLEVDNCELFNWGYAAVRLDGVMDDSGRLTTGDIHHNYIHHNNKDGLGYGTVINYKNVASQILYNWYDENRHSVAGNGRLNERYTAAYNLTLRNQMSAEYDMHGYSDFNKKNCEALIACNPYRPCNLAGAEVILVHNAVLEAKYFFGIRGIPTEGAYVTQNFSNAPNFYRLWRTWTYTDELGPCDLSPPNNAQIRLQEGQWEQYKLRVWDNNKNAGAQSVHYISWSGVNRWQPLFFHAYRKGRTAYGDFDGNGKSDLFYGDGSRWWVSWNGVTPWERLNTSNYTTERLGFGDFNGDGRTDIFLADGSSWRVSWGGNSPWQRINTSSATTSDLAFGDFNGDGRTDIFLANGSSWRVSWSGTSRWERINTSSAKNAQLAFGDFNGDGRTDIFLANGSSWRVSWSGTSSWQRINTSSYKGAQLAFGDFNGDGRTDVFRADGSRWQISRSGTSSWQRINTSGYKLPQLSFGDFDGDGRTDVVRAMGF